LKSNAPDLKEFANLTLKTWRWKTENPVCQRMTEGLTRVREVECSNPDRPNLTQRCKRFATASKSTQVAVLLLALCRGDGHRKLAARFDVIRWVKDLVLGWFSKQKFCFSPKIKSD